MSLSTFKGQIRPGTITARFQADFSNESADLLTISYAEVGGANPQVGHGAATPGGFARVGVSVTNDGILEIWVVAGHEEDSGRLEVSSDGTALDSDAVQGSVRWVYSVATA